MFGFFKKRTGTPLKPVISKSAGALKCPYCLQEIQPGEILFLNTSDAGDPDTVFEEFAKKYQGFTETGSSAAHAHSIIEPFIDDGLDRKVEHKNGFPSMVTVTKSDGSKFVTSTRICPHCHCKLPDDLETMEVRHVMMLGTTSCGKTSLISAMLYHMMGDLTKGKFGSRILPSSLGIAQIEDDSQIFASYFMQKWMDSQREATDTRPIFPIVFNWKSPNKSKCLICLYDFAGEGFAKADYFLNHPAYKTDLDGLLLAVDSNQMDCCRAQNVQNKASEDMALYMENLPEQIRQYLQKSDCTAVTLTKFDSYLRFSDNQTPAGYAYMHGLDCYKDDVSIDIMKSVSNEVRKIMDRESSSTKDTIESVMNRSYVKGQELGTIEYFATSSMQICEKENDFNSYENRFSAANLHRVIEPLLYMLARWDKVGTSVAGKSK